MGRAGNVSDILDVGDDIVLRVQMDDGEHIVLQRSQFDPQEVVHQLRRSQCFAVAHLSGQHTMCCLHHLVGIGWAISRMFHCL